MLKREKREKLSAGEVGYIIAGVKTVADVRTGDTITLQDNLAASRCPDLKKLNLWSLLPSILLLPTIIRI